MTDAKRTTIGAILALLLALAGIGGLTAAAQDAPAEIPFTIAKFNCPTDPGEVNPAQGLDLPEECDPAAGVAFSVTGEDGTELATCTTDGNGLCQLMLPNEATVTVTEDVDTAPAGFAPRENPITTQVVTEFAGALFINLPTQEPPPTDGGDTFDLPILKLDCTVEPSDDAVRDFALFGDEAIPANCTIAVGVIFSVTDAAGNPISTCQLNADGVCTVAVPVPSTVTVTEDVGTAAAGFAPRENPITVEVEPATEASAIFINLPVDEDTDDDVTVPVDDDTVALPDTGAGTTAAGGQSGMLPFAALIALASGMVYRLHRRMIG